MSKKIFPVDTKTGCPLKWNWSTIFFQSGTSSSCHRTEKLKIPEHNFDSFHNLPKKIDDRQRMLEGLWPKNTCGYCSEVEKQNGYSDRMNQLAQLTDSSAIPPELLKNPKATAVTPTFVEVYFSNTCNMSCVYCGPHFSSKWEEEIKKYGIIKEMDQDVSLEYAVQKIQKNTLYDKQKQDFWNYLKTNERYKILRWFSFLGGEPLVIPELNECLDFWNNNSNDKLTFQIVTNLKTTDIRFQNFLNRIKQMIKERKVYKFKIIASIDCFGDEIEYVRYGLNQKKWIESFEKILLLDGVDVGINCAISALTLKKFPILMDKINEWNRFRSKNNRIILSFNLDENLLTDPRIFGGNFFQDTLKECNEKMFINTVRDISIKKHWQSLSNSILHSKFDCKRVKDLKNYLTALDIRRNTDWKKVFPWLVDL